MSNLPDHIRNQPWRRSIQSQETSGSSEQPAGAPTRTPLMAINSREQATSPENTLAETPSRVENDNQWRRRAAPPTGTATADLRSARWAAYGRRSENPRSSNVDSSGRSSVGSWRASQSRIGASTTPLHRSTGWDAISPSTIGHHGPSASAVTASAPQAQEQVQTADQLRTFQTYERNCHRMQNITLTEGQCDESKEYAQWAGRFVEVNETLLARICPCNLVGKPCPFDELEGGCPMIRLCGQLEKWTIHKCPDTGFRTILDAVERVPLNYGDRFGAVNTYDGSDNESGGVALSSEASSEAGGVTVPEYHGKKVSFNDFSCGVENECGHIHWEVEINCRFVGWSHFKPDTVCKQVREKGRLCSCGHDLEEARQRARDAVREHERMAIRCGAPPPRDLGRVWVY